MVLRVGRRAAELPEGGDCRVVHPPADEREVALDADGYEAEGAERGAGLRPFGDAVEQVTVGDGEPLPGGGLDVAPDAVAVRRVPLELRGVMDDRLRAIVGVGLGLGC